MCPATPNPARPTPNKREYFISRLSRYQKIRLWRAADDLAFRVRELAALMPAEARAALARPLRLHADAAASELEQACAITDRERLVERLDAARRAARMTQELLLSAFLRDLLAGPDHRQLAAGYEEVRRMLEHVTEAPARPVPARRPGWLTRLAYAAAAVLVAWLAAKALSPAAQAQSSNGALVLRQETVPASGGVMDNGGTLRAVAVLGEPAGGRAASAARTLRGGFQPFPTPLARGTRLVDVTGTIDDAAASVTVNSVPAPIASGAYRAAGVQLFEGPNAITTTATDAAGNRSTRSITVHLDTQPPARPTVAAPALWTSSASQSLSGTKLAGTTVWINGSQITADPALTTWTAAVSLSEGDNVVSVVTKDAAGNASTAQAVLLVRDAAAPVISATPPGKTNLNPFGFSGDVDDSLTTVTVNGVTAERAGKHFDAAIPLSLGANTVTVSAKGPNPAIAAAVKTYALTLGRVPTISAAIPADATKLPAGAAVAIQITATDPEADPITYQVLLDGAVLRDWASANTASWTPADAQIGLHLFELRARDAYGGFASRQSEVYVARKPVPHP